MAIQCPLWEPRVGMTKMDRKQASYYFAPPNIIFVRTVVQHRAMSNCALHTERKYSGLFSVLCVDN